MVKINLVQPILAAVPPIAAAHRPYFLHFGRGFIFQHDCDRHLPPKEALFSQVRQGDVRFSCIPSIGLNAFCGKALPFHLRRACTDAFCPPAARNINVDMRNAMVAQLFIIRIRKPGRAGILAKLMPRPPADEYAALKHAPILVQRARKLQNNSIARAVISHAFTMGIIMAIHQNEVILRALNKCHGN